MKRLLRIISQVTIALMTIINLSLMVMANENNENINDEAQIVEQLTLMQGEGNGLDEEYLNKATTRFQVAIVTLKLYGKYEEALAFESEENFVDANQVSWTKGRNILAYLKAHPEYGWNGIGENNFDPNGSISAQGFYKVLLESLGYKKDKDFTWNTTFQMAKEKGLAMLSNVQKMKNKHLVTGIVEVLKAKRKDGTIYIESLVQLGIVPEAIAVESGLYNLRLITADGEDTRKVKLAIKEIKMNNETEMEVKFNTDITVQLDHRYSIGTNPEDNREILEPSDFKFYVDDKYSQDARVIKILRKPNTDDTLYLYVERVQGNSEGKVLLKLEGQATSLQTKYGKINTFKENGHVQELVVSNKEKVNPHITKVEQIGDNILDVIFSEPVYTSRDASFETEDAGLTNQNSVLALSDYEAIEDKEKLKEMLEKKIIVVNATDNRLIEEKYYVVSHSADGDQVTLEFDGGKFLEGKTYKIAIKKGVDLYSIDGTYKVNTSNTVRDTYPNSNITNAYEFEGSAKEQIKAIAPYLLDGSKNKMVFMFEGAQPLYSNKSLDEIKKGISIARDGTDFKPLERLDSIDLYNSYLSIKLKKNLTGDKTKFKVEGKIFYDITGNLLDEFMTEPIDATGFGIDRIDYNAKDKEIILHFDAELQLMPVYEGVLADKINCMFCEEIEVIDARAEENKFIFTINQGLEGSKEFMLFSGTLKNDDDMVNDDIRFTVYPIEPPTKEAIDKISFIKKGDYIEVEPAEGFNVSNLTVQVKFYGDDRWFDIGTIDGNGNLHPKENAIDFSDWITGTAYFKYVPNN